ncbi:MAG: DNA polymerase III subunit delta' [Bacillota bacterium]
MGFETIFGQKMLKKALQHSLAREETGHAYLFSGPPGSGKKTLALLFAQALNCPEADPPCRRCLSCRKSESGNHPDFYRLRPQGGSLKIEQLREIKESLYYLPVEGKHKICIIEDAELLTAPAANSLLKILEEPPASLVFILLTSRPWSLLPTVLSRCASFNLKPLEPQEMAAVLAQKVKLPPQEQEIIIALSGGNPGQALEQAAQGDWRKKFTEARTLLHTVEHGPADGIFPLAEELSNRDDLPVLLNNMLLLYRDRLVCSLEGCAGEVIIKEKDESHNINTPHLHTVFLEKICRVLLQLQSELRGNVNRRLCLEVLFLQMRGVI